MDTSILICNKTTNHIKNIVPKTKYNDIELNEFQELIQEKLYNAHKELHYLTEQIHKSTNGDADSKIVSLEDGARTLEKEYLNQMAARQVQYIQHLENALIRIKNKTYGICRSTGLLINKERLKAVPHTTLSIEAKNKGIK